ncbi:hypothetical protein ANANG_G00241110 [Anguilla anguilla]|uniref:B-cell lymphoma 9 beta-catenin binding domain-containing protein n=1 Tax=Anguilla anguilla TaxID=7936 RepID=A0A9D3LWE4_ANGAN|nr:hypothetical protein ANANG_G00241110 [Anguilla anguilla]
MGGAGGGGNGRLMDMHQEGPRGPRFLGQMQRGPPGVAAAAAAGVVTRKPGRGHAHGGHGTPETPRPGMGWLEDMPPNMAGGGPFQMCYPPGGPQHLQGDGERPLTREEMFRLLEKRQLQTLHRLELERLAKQQAGLLGFPNPPRGDPMDFPSMRAMMGFGMSMNMNMGPQMSSQQQQQMMLAQKLRAGLGRARAWGRGALSEMLSPEEISQIRAAQNGRGGERHDALPQSGAFPGTGYRRVPPGGGAGYVRARPAGPAPPPDGRDVPAQPHAPECRPRGRSWDPGTPPTCPSTSTPWAPRVAPPHQLKSPLSQDASPLLPSPSGLAPEPQIAHGPPAGPLPPSAAGTLSSSLKSPQVMGPSSWGLRSPSASPGRLRSPAMPIASPGWAASPKPALPSPAGTPAAREPATEGELRGDRSEFQGTHSDNEDKKNSLCVCEKPIAASEELKLHPHQPAGLHESQHAVHLLSGRAAHAEPLSLIMSQMSKYAMPSSTPLYHEAIKTIATSDDEMTPDRPLLPGVNMAGNMGNHQSSQQMLITSQSSMGPHSGSQSPMGMVLQGPPQLSHDPSGSMLHSPNPMGIPGMNPALMGGGGGPPDGMGPCSVSPMLPQNQMGGFSRMQPQSQGSLHSPSPGMGQQYPQPPPEDMLPHQQGHILVKRGPHPSEPFHPSLPMGDGPDLSDVIRATPTGIPEFDLSRIIPSDKPSSTLQYFPKADGMSQAQMGGAPHLKQHLSSSGPAPSSGPTPSPTRTSPTCRT